MKLKSSRTLVVALTSVAMLAAAGAACAQEPVQNIDPQRHGVLAAAQNLVVGAYDRLTAAQVDNREGLGGHAARAKELLREANYEIKLAAVAANRR